MESIIKIGKQEVKLSNNFAWLIEYNDQFGRDALADVIPFAESVAEMLATILSDGESTELGVGDIFSALEGRSMDVMLPLVQSMPSMLIINITWAMAKAADETIDPPKKWVRQFDEFPLDTVVPELWKLVSKGMISSKNLKRLKTAAKKIPKSLQPSRPTTSSSEQSNEG